MKNFTFKYNYDDKELNEIHNWKSLESIICYLNDIYQFFNNINLLEKLTTCIIYSRDEDDLMKP